MSTVSVCPIEEVAPKIKRPMWFQLYVLKDRGFMQNALERAQAAGCSTLVFTVDMPVPGARYRDAHSGMRSEEHTSELQSQSNLVCRLLLEKKKKRRRAPDAPAQHTPTGR